MRPLLFVITLIILGGLPLAMYSQRALTPEQEMRSRDARNNADVNRRMGVMERLENMRHGGNGKKETREERKADKEAYERLAQLRQVNPDDAVKYKSFLASGTGGLFRLFPDFDCVTPDLIRSDGDCAAFVDSSSAYSFRVRTYLEGGRWGYQQDFLNDIRFNQNKLTGMGFFEHEALVSLGDIPIENLTLADAGLRFLVDLQPAGRLPEARELSSRLARGIESGGYNYADSVRPQENTTYAMRLIAYNYAGVIYGGFSNYSRPEAKLLAMQSDKREDVIIIFRIVRRDSDGSITILWKELERNKAPKIKFAKGERPSDFTRH